MPTLNPSICIACRTECKCNSFLYSNSCEDDCCIGNNRFCEQCRYEVKTVFLDDDEIKVFINDLAIEIEEQQVINKELSDKNIIYSQQIKYLIKNTTKLMESFSDLVEQNKLLTNRVKVLETVYNFRPNPNAMPFVPSVPSVP